MSYEMSSYSKFPLSSYVRTTLWLVKIEPFRAKFETYYDLLIISIKIESSNVECSKMAPMSIFTNKVRLYFEWKRSDLLLDVRENRPKSVLPSTKFEPKFDDLENQHESYRLFCRLWRLLPRKLRCFRRQFQIYATRCRQCCRRLVLPSNRFQLSDFRIRFDHDAKITTKTIDCPEIDGSIFVHNVYGTRIANQIVVLAPNVWHRTFILDWMSLISMFESMWSKILTFIEIMTSRMLSAPSVLEDTFNKTVSSVVIICRRKKNRIRNIDTVMSTTNQKRPMTSVYIRILKFDGKSYNRRPLFSRTRLRLWLEPFAFGSVYQSMVSLRIRLRLD